MTHTPAPWTRSSQPGSNEIMALDNGNCLVLRAKVYGRTEEEVEANADLVAAAADLLKVAQGCLGYFEYMAAQKSSLAPDESWLAPLKAAISKATPS